MKKALAILLACTLFFLLAACGERSPALMSNDTPPATQNGSQTAQSSGDVPPPEPERSESVPPAASGKPASAEELWQKLDGCWTAADERFAYFTCDDYGPAFWSGQWENPIPYRREAAKASADLTDLGDGLYTVEITYPPATEAADAQELRPLSYTLTLDLSGLERDGKISLKAPEDQMRQYAWGGASYDDACDSVHDVQYASFAEMQNLWGELDGYWDSEDGRFVVFGQTDDATLSFQEGMLDAGEGRGAGTFEKAMTAMGESPIQLIVHYPAIGEENQMDGPLPELFLPVYLDTTALSSQGTLGIKIGDEGVWSDYLYAGERMEDLRRLTR